MKLEGIVDRIEEEWAVLELNGEFFIDFPLAYLPKGIKEGEMVFFEVTKAKK